LWEVIVWIQDVSGGQPVPVEGTALPLWGLEIDPDRAKEDFKAFNARDDGKVSILGGLKIFAIFLLSSIGRLRDACNEPSAPALPHLKVQLLYHLDCDLFLWMSWSFLELPVQDTLLHPAF